MSRERTPEPSEAPTARERTTTTTTTEITVPADVFALRETMTQLDGIAFEIERVVASDDEWSGCGAPFVRVNSPEHGSDGIEAAFDDDSDYTVEISAVTRPSSEMCERRNNVRET